MSHHLVVVCRFHCEQPAPATSEKSRRRTDWKKVENRTTDGPAHTPPPPLKFVASLSLSLLCVRARFFFSHFPAPCVWVYENIVRKRMFSSYLSFFNQFLVTRLCVCTCVSVSAVWVGDYLVSVYMKCQLNTSF